MSTSPEHMDDVHEIIALKRRVWILEEALRELLIYASPIPSSAKEAGDLCKYGYTSELAARFTQIGSVKVADRVETIRKLLTPAEEGEIVASAKEIP